MELLPPPFGGRETALRVGRLTKTEEKETIIINRSDRATYPQRKSVSRSGATPTYWYLSALPGLMREAVSRLERHWEELRP
jgi:hypothetical protein